jgi:hypothetical protein
MRGICLGSSRRARRVLTVLGMGAAVAVAPAVTLGAGSAAARDHGRVTGAMGQSSVSLPSALVPPAAVSAAQAVPAAPAIPVQVPSTASIHPASAGTSTAAAGPARVPESNACRGNARSVTRRQDRGACAQVSFGVGHKVG